MLTDLISVFPHPPNPLLPACLLNRLLLTNTGPSVWLNLLHDLLVDETLLGEKIQGRSSVFTCMMSSNRVESMCGSNILRWKGKIEWKCALGTISKAIKGKSWKWDSSSPSPMKTRPFLERTSRTSRIFSMIREINKRCARRIEQGKVWDENDQGYTTVLWEWSRKLWGKMHFNQAKLWRETRNSLARKKTLRVGERNVFHRSCFRFPPTHLYSISHSDMCDCWSTFITLSTNIAYQACYNEGTPQTCSSFINKSFISDSYISDASERQVLDIADKVAILSNTFSRH